VRAEVGEPERSGLAQILDDLIRQNLGRDPTRRRLLRASAAVIEVPDASVVVTVRIRPREVEVSDGAAPAPVRVRADSDRLLALAAMPLRLGLPDPFSAEGRAVLADLALGRVRVRGLVSHLPTVRRLTMLLSAR
jgi:hypothetical protein